jgi:transposase
MRTLKLHFPNDTLPTLDTFLKQTTEARVFRRAQAVREVVKGQRLQTVSDTLHFTYSALRKWVHRFAHQGTRGLVDRPRSGRPPKLTCELEQHLNRLVAQDPLQHGSLYSQWSWGVFFSQRRRVREKSTHYGTLYLKQDLSGGSSYCIHQSPTRKVPYYGSTSCHH